jgi:hypothetical protein
MIIPVCSELHIHVECEHMANSCCPKDQKFLKPNVRKLCVFLLVHHLKYTCQMINLIFVMLPVHNMKESSYVIQYPYRML